MHAIVKKGQDRIRDLIALALFVWCLFIAVYLYHNGLYGPLLLDDEIHLVPLLEDDLSAGGWSAYLFSNSGPLKRPIAMASFLFNAVTSGDDLYWWKFTNLMIHLLTAISIFCFSFYLFSSVTDAPDRIESRVVSALIPAVLWLFHPLHVSTVLYTVQRMAQLSALFVFAALAAYLAGRLRQLSGKNGSLLIFTSFFFFLPLGAMSKENALLFPVYVLLIEFFFLRYRIWRNGIVIASQTIRNCILMPLTIACAYILINAETLILQYYSYRDFTLSERLFTEFRILIRYLGQIIIPLQGNMGFMHDDIILSRGWFSPPTTIISFFTIIALLLIAWLTRAKNPFIGFGICFYFAAHLMESTVLPLELMFEHRNYIPAYGIFLIITSLLQDMIQNRLSRVSIVIVMVSVLSIQTKILADIWSSIPGMYAYMSRIHPDSQRLVAMQARILAEKGLYRDAQQILSRFDSEGSILQRKYLLCQDTGQLSDEDIMIAINSINGPVDMYAVSEARKLADSGLEGECIFSENLFISLLDKILEQPVSSNFERQRILVYKGRYLWKLGNHEGALHALEEASKIVVDDPIPMLLAAEWMVRLGEIEQAKHYYAIAKNISGKSTKKYELIFRSIDKLIDNTNKPEQTD